MNKPRTKVLVLWIAAAVVAAGGTTTAVVMAGGGTDVLSDEEVAAKLGAGQSYTYDSGKKTGLLPAKPGEEVELTSKAATVFVRCKGGKVAGARVALQPGWRITQQQTEKSDPDKPWPVYHYTFGDPKGDFVDINWACEGDVVTSSVLVERTKSR